MKIRMSPDLRERIETASKTNGRSINAEIVHRLENSLQREEVLEAAKERAKLREAEPVTPLSELSEEMRMVSKQIAAISKAIEKLNKE